MKKRKPVVHGADWTIYDDGTIKVNYGGYQEPQWEPWQSKFCWLPTKIVMQVSTDDGPYRPYWKVSKLVWWRTIYIRRRLITHYPENNYEYEYAEDLFDLIKKESR